VILFTDLSSDRVVKALQKADFKIIKQGKHMGMSNGKRRVTIPRHKRLNPYNPATHHQRCRID
jgi:predicted RNA binding protein YcfA (HicA-like mRNA interferase family)